MASDKIFDVRLSNSPAGAAELEGWEVTFFDIFQNGFSGLDAEVRLDLREGEERLAFLVLTFGLGFGHFFK